MPFYSISVHIHLLLVLVLTSTSFWALVLTCLFKGVFMDYREMVVSSFIEREVNRQIITVVSASTFHMSLDEGKKRFFCAISFWINSVCCSLFLYLSLLSLSLQKSISVGENITKYVDVSFTLHLEIHVRRIFTVNVYIATPYIQKQCQCKYWNLFIFY